MKQKEELKHLELCDICVGDWVQAKPFTTNRFTCPMKITGIFLDGTVYTMVDKEQGDPFEYRMDEIYPLPITGSIIRLLSDKNENLFAGFGHCKYVHQLQHEHYKKYGYALFLEWYKTTL